MTQPSSLWATSYKAKYFPRCSFWEAGTSNTHSWLWRSLLRYQSQLAHFVAWQVGDGTSIRFWDDTWVSSKKLSDFVVSIPPTAPTLVSDVIINRCWNLQKLREFLRADIVDEIFAIPLSTTPASNKLVWPFHPTGVFTLKTAYQQLVKHKSPIPRWPWYRLWKLKTLPKLRFLFGLWRRANFLNELFSLLLPAPCVTRSDEESAEHLFFLLVNMQR